MNDQIVGEITDEYELEPDEGPAQEVLAYRAPLPSTIPSQEEVARKTCNCEVAWCEHQSYRMT